MHISRLAANNQAVIPQEVLEAPAVRALSPAGFQERHGHLICGMITSAAHSAWPTDVPLTAYQEAGLHKPCKVRLKLFTVEAGLVLYRVGEVAGADREAITTVTRALLPR